MKFIWGKITSLMMICLAIATLSACSGSDVAGALSGNSYSCSVSQAKANTVTNGMNLAQVRNAIGCDGRLYHSQGQLTSWYFEETPTKLIVVIFIDGAAYGSAGYFQ